ncbi:MAG: division/cell wall cluster transcriptional repressor MraZ [Firmicutes bacterium]|jgi:mraZ protein|nr:division/cell wall cluster transcriptional repressor MraZ [Bacillota bacterium]
MFNGRYNHTIDSKGRIIIPSKFRSGLEGVFMLTKGLDGCLFIITMDEWDSFREKIREISISSDQGRAFTRYFFSNAVDCELDKQGRLNIPQDLLDHAKISKDVVTIGVDTRVEVWSKEVWEAYCSTPMFSSENIAENMRMVGA